MCVKFLQNFIHEIIQKTVIWKIKNKMQKENQVEARWGKRRVCDVKDWM